MTNIKRYGKYDYEFVSKDLEGYDYDLFQGAAQTFGRDCKEFRNFGRSA
jgi:hypothetical protein